MSTERIRELAARFLSGQPLADEEKRELLGALEADLELRVELLKEMRVHGLLHLMGSVEEPDAEGFIRSTLVRVEAQEDGEGFLKRVHSGLEGASSPLEADPSRRPPTRRKFQLIRKGSGADGWKIGLAAAGVLAAVVVFGTILSWGRTGSPPNRDEAQRQRETRAREEAERRETRRRPLEEQKGRAATEQKRLADELAAMEAERRKLDAARKEGPAEADRKRVEEELERVAARFREKTAELERARAAAEKAERELVQATPPAPAAPKTQEPKVQETKVAVAKVGQAENAVVVMADGARVPVREAQDVLAGQGLEVLANGSARLAYSDQTQVHVGPETELRELKTEGGKRLFVLKGTIRAEVTKQPKDQPMVIATPHGEATVVGTTLRIIIDPDPKKGTRLEVEEGKVQLKNKLLGKTVEVMSGHYAVAAGGVELVSRPLPRVLFAEDFQTQPVDALPRGFEVDLPGTWAVRGVEGGRALEGRGAATSLLFGDAAWADYEVTFRFRFDASPSILGLIVRHDPGRLTNYQLEVRPDGTWLRRSLAGGMDDPNEFRGAALRPVPAVWHTFRAMCRGAVVEFWIDDKLALRSRETHSPRGRCKLYVRGGAAQFDDIRVIDLSR